MCIDLGVSFSVHSPQAMIWPRPLAQIAINKALHNENGREGNFANGWTISRLKFFMYCFVGMFLYYVSFN